MSELTDAPKGMILAGEPMGLFIAQTEGPLDTVEGFSMAVAGAEFNVAVGLSRLEHRASYLTKLGEDPFGRHIRRSLCDNGIGDELVTFTSERSTGFMLKGRTSKGDPDIFYFRRGSAASTLSPADVERIDFSRYGFLHLTGILPALTQETRAATFALRDRALAAGLFVSFDPNLRPQLWKSREEMRDTLNELARGVDLALPGEGEGELLCGSGKPELISDFYLAAGAGAVVTKLGPRGAFVAEKGERYIVPGFRVEKVVDTVGAGDGFAAGVLSALMEGLPLREAVRRGNAVGAIQVMSRGDNEGLPTRAELARFMEGEKK